uniref:cancer/testis antigen 55-like n=1 Tax=Jaculus jaculus TaxID=51337 RepID=UPI001E1B4F82|nr:cancer/testis antigen 55-like [Jaculus jaculus]
MLKFLRQNLPFWRRVNSEEGQQRRLKVQSSFWISSCGIVIQNFYSADILNSQTMIGDVTSFSVDHGWIDDYIFFSTDVVTGNEPLKLGQRVKAVVEEDKTSHRLKATKVDALADNFDDTRLSGRRIKILIGCVTRVKKNIIYIDKNNYFPLQTVSEDFVPYAGDWIEVGYSMQPGKSKISVHLAKPMKCKVVNEVLITSLEGRHGMIDYTIFFTLDSLKLPSGYVPRLYDTVDIVMVESSQLCSVWRAISMTPVQRSS